MGKRTSVYLSDELDAAVKAAGVPLAELIRRGLGEPVPPSVPGPDVERRTLLDHGPQVSRVAITPERADQREAEPCPHPPGRRLKGLCMACGSRPE